MRKENSVKMNLDVFEGMVQRLRSYETRVGVLGAKTERPDGDGMTNAEIGLIHLFGSNEANIPPRDWLIAPIVENQRELVNSLSANSVQQAFKRGDYKGVMALIGIKAEELVQRAFETSGFGKWAPNSPVTIARKGSSKPLIDTSQLRRSVSSDVVKKGKS
jgi:phage gpG-like protein